MPGSRQMIFEDKLQQFGSLLLDGTGRVGNCTRCCQAFSCGSIVSWILVAS